MRKKALVLAAFGLVLLALDIATKWWIQAYIPHVRESMPHYPYGGLGIFSNFHGIEFSITHATNTGAIWGTFTGYPYILLAIRAAVVIGLIGYLLIGKRPRSAIVPLLLVIVGAIGNMVDIFAYGHVIDMFSFRFWGWHYPIFNLADSMIFIGIAWLLVLSFFRKSTQCKSPSG